MTIPRLAAVLFCAPLIAGPVALTTADVEKMLQTLLQLEPLGQR